MKCKKCVRELRPRETRKADYPGTVEHYGQGYCQTCFNIVSPERERTKRPDNCVICEKAMRPGSGLVADYPGTVRHKAYGKCWNCYKRTKEGPTDDSDLEYKPEADAELGAGLGWFMSDRAARIRRQEQMRRVRIAQEAARARFIQSRRAA